MSKQTINLGAIANDQTGDALRDGGRKINENFTELYEGKQDINGNLTALAAIIGQADRLPYFTGVGALSVTTLNALGRSIIGAVSQLAARQALGLGTSSTFDRGAANGVASLGADGKLVPSQTPDMSINDVYPVNSQAAMLALPADQGDIAIRTDELNKPYILGALPASTLANWYPIGQSLSAALAALSGLTPAADRIPYYTGANTAALATFNSLGRSLVGAASAAAARSVLSAQVETPGFIEGLTLTWLSTTSINIDAGSAYVPSVGRVVSFAGQTFTPMGVVDVNSFIYLYLTDVGTIQQSLTVPVKYGNQGWQMTGNNARRCIGALHVTTNAAGVTKFVHRPQLGMILYTLANPQASPFRLLAGVTGIGSISTRPTTPVMAHTLEATFQNTGTLAARVTPSDAGTNVATGWMAFINPGQIWNARMAIAADGSITYDATSPASLSVYIQGYYFDR